MPEAQSLNPRHVFVYGTLRNGGSNDITLLRPAPRYVGMGTVPGVLYKVAVSQPGNYWYPGLTLGGDEAVSVVGEVYEITPALEAVLDGIEQVEPGPDSEYFKRELEIDVEGRVLRCLVYEINPRHVLDRERIGHGDWILFHSTQ